jgi:hypothetical protein
MGKLGGVSLVVSQDGKVELDYPVMSMAEAVKLIHFLREFMPQAQFLLQPVRH